MRCDLIIESMSARLDGEEPPLSADVVAAHVAHCDRCTTFQRQSEALHRRLRVQPAAEIADMTDRILSTVDPDAPPADSERRS